MILRAASTSSGAGENASLHGSICLRMNQRLAVEPELARLPAFVRETFRIAEIVVDAVENLEAKGARGRKAVHQPRQHRRAAGHDARPRILGEVVGAHDEAGQPRLRIQRRRGDLATLSIASGVSIMAHTRMCGSVPMSTMRAARSCN